MNAFNGGLGYSTLGDDDMSIGPFVDDVGGFPLDFGSRNRNAAFSKLNSSFVFGDIERLGGDFLPVDENITCSEFFFRVLLPKENTPILGARRVMLDDQRVVFDGVAGKRRIYGVVCGGDVRNYRLLLWGNKKPEHVYLPIVTATPAFEFTGRSLHARPMMNMSQTLYHTQGARDRWFLENMDFQVLLDIQELLNSNMPISGILMSLDSGSLVKDYQFDTLGQYFLALHMFCWEQGRVSPMKVRLFLLWLKSRLGKRITLSDALFLEKAILGDLCDSCFARDAMGGSKNQNLILAGLPPGSSRETDLLRLAFGDSPDPVYVSLPHISGAVLQNVAILQGDGEHSGFGVVTRSPDVAETTIAIFYCRILKELFEDVRALRLGLVRIRHPWSPLDLSLLTYSLRDFHRCRIGGYLLCYLALGKIPVPVASRVNQAKGYEIFSAIVEGLMVDHGLSSLVHNLAMNLF